MRYTNMQYPTLDLFEGARLERYLRISFALLVFVTPLVIGSPTSSRIGSFALPPSISLVHSSPPVLAKSPAKIPTPPPTSAGSLAWTPDRPFTHTPARS
ncbi:hypothetical protein LWI28_008458 [Acer negundo]|uniref:Uncharacterized protein n=1 Tax=Acer negundo TaxID=4023 RepID=A0AAD5NWS7_ACENE|nr:hypothetical protein LWI28_008458 [Acer negundo]